MNKNAAYLIAILLTLPVVDALACSCLTVPDQQRYLDASDVFLGTVVETKLFTKTKNIDELQISTEQVGAKIKITQRIKGDASEHIDVVDGVANGANCAVGLFTGRDYLFYLYGNNMLSICDGTRLYNEFADEELIDEMLSN